MQQSSIHILDRDNGQTFIYYEDAVENLTNRDLHPMKHYLRKRMHLIRHGAYDKTPTE
ncbi:hypothetical protein SAMN04487943_11276 [Gracilibacillus orientalis]|uniref:Uncharacterized protein n=1 Tax=Gracilibacillus orientalis TaxID=334253 RepID=A0A1I4PNH5_9BACI|nr:hypothetical protein SAMN04487943_11276 [Gracilibacillus orientalis]